MQLPHHGTAPKIREFFACSPPLLRPTTPFSSVIPALFFSIFRSKPFFSGSSCTTACVRFNSVQRPTFLNTRADLPLTCFPRIHPLKCGNPCRIRTELGPSLNQANRESSVPPCSFIFF